MLVTYLRSVRVKKKKKNKTDRRGFKLGKFIVAEIVSLMREFGSDHKSAKSS